MRNIKQKRALLPPWNMPSDPVKAVWWFLHWLLKVLVRFFWLPIIGMVIYETYLSARVSGITNGIVAGVITLLVGLVVWGGLYGVLFALNISTTISQTLADVGRVQRTFSSTRRPPPLYSFPPEAEPEEPNVVEGTITDLEEERKKRRKE